MCKLRLSFSGSDHLAGIDFTCRVLCRSNPALTTLFCQQIRLNYNTALTHQARVRTGAGAFRCYPCVFFNGHILPLPPKPNRNRDPESYVQFAAELDSVSFRFSHDNPTQVRQLIQDKDDYRDTSLVNVLTLPYRLWITSPFRCVARGLFCPPDLRAVARQHTDVVILDPRILSPSAAYFFVSALNGFYRRELQCVDIPQTPLDRTDDFPPSTA